MGRMEVENISKGCFKMGIRIDFSRYSKSDFEELANKHGLTMEELEAAIDDTIEERCEYIACTPIDRDDVKLRIKGSIVPGSFFVHGIEELYPQTVEKGGETVTVWEPKNEEPTAREYFENPKKQL